MIYLSFDASTKSTGYSVFDDDNLVEYGLIRPNLKNPYDRIEYIYKRCMEIFEKYDIGCVFIEDVPLSSAVNKKVAEKLILLQGTIYSLCIQYDCTFMQLEPSHWRKLAGVCAEKNRRELQKKAAIDLVNRIYSFKYKWIDKKYDDENGDSDVCEAILIGIAGKKKIKGDVV